MADLTAATLRQAIEDRRLLNSDAAMFLIELHHADQFLRLLEAEEAIDVRLDRQWVAGCQAGWQFGCADRQDLYLSAIESRMRGIAAAKAAEKREAANV